jgi:hypothetical protein
MNRQTWHGRLLVGLTVAFVSAGLLVTVTAQSASNILYACVHNVTGALRLAPAGVSCLQNESLIQWNVTGPQGPQGPVGPTGPNGPQGPQGPAGSTASSEPVVVGTMDGAPLGHPPTDIYGLTWGVTNPTDTSRNVTIKKTVDQFTAKLMSAAYGSDTQLRGNVDIVFFVPGTQTRLGTYTLVEPRVVSVDFAVRDGWLIETDVFNYCAMETSISVGDHQYSFVTQNCRQ